MANALSFAQVQTLKPAPRILTTKLFAPRARAQRVARPRLTQRLTEGLHHTMTLISAPAGWGKTTLLSEWRETPEAQTVAMAWVSLDKGDNDFARFVTYLIAALQTIQPDMGTHAHALLSAPPIASEAILISLINDLAAYDGELALLLDDAHVIESQTIHEALEFLLDYLPPHVHLIMASRTEPPLALARLRARNQLTEIHAADLRFTLDEATDFLQRVMKLNLSATELATLIDSTEGWAAGLQLAALSLQNPTDGSRPPGAMSGSNRYILDYLVEEVLQRQTEDVQTFLLQTSILDRLSGPLCDAVMGFDRVQSSSQAMLELLDRLNLFIVPLDTARQWYRYHHLFAELLRDRLAHWQPDRAPQLHQRASAWFADHALPREAIQHALAAGDHDRAAELIEPVARELLGRNEADRLYQWLTALPQSLILAHIGLTLKLAWAQVLTGHLNDASDTLDALESRLADGAQAARGELCAIRATLAIRRGQWPEACQLLCTAWDLVPADLVMLRGVVAANRGIAALFQGDLVTATPWFAQAIDLSLACHNPRTALTSFNNLGAIQALRGQLHAAADTYRRAIAYADQHIQSDDLRQRAMTAMLHIGLAETLYEWNELDVAEAEVRLGWCASNDQVCDEQAQLAGYLMLARLQQARGRLDGAITVLNEGEAFGQRCVSQWAILCDVKTLRARYQLQSGDEAATVRWAHAANVTLDAPPDQLAARANAYLVRARLLLAQHDPQAIELLTRLIAALDVSQQRGVQLEAQVVLAQAQHQCGQPAAALMTLQHALELAASERYTRVFLDDVHLRPVLFELRAQLRARPDSLVVNQLDRILATIAVAPHAASASSGELVEPLNERELDVLRLIADGHSNHDIAQELIVAVSTVKWHINNLYAKLNVHSRTLAIARARELGLLQTMHSVGSYQSRSL